MEKEKKLRILEDEDSDEERSIIELTKPEVKNVKIEGVLPLLPEASDPQILNQFVSKQTEQNIQIMRKQAKLKRKRRKKKKKLQEAFEEQDEAEKVRENLIREQLLKLDPTKAASKQDSSFYPAPKNLEKRRCYIHKNARALKCTVCDGGETKTLCILFFIFFIPVQLFKCFLIFFIAVHYRTRRTFKSNLRILANVNMGFVKTMVGVDLSCFRLHWIFFLQKFKTLLIWQVF